MPPHVLPLRLDVAPDLEDLERADPNPRFFQGLADRGLFDCLPDLKRATRHAPSALVRLGAPFHEEDFIPAEDDHADRRDGSLGEFVWRRHGRSDIEWNYLQACAA